jgi:methylenetetrahydrofolate--tRNA-(uracil-5-)-methyltransferase
MNISPSPAPPVTSFLNLFGVIYPFFPLFLAFGINFVGISHRMPQALHIIGGGLAGVEAAWRALAHGLSAVIWEMKPFKYSPAHKSPGLAELVCSNSLRAESPENAVGLLKEELRLLGSLVLRAADETRVPAGKALAVDRVLFSERVTRLLESQERVTIIREEKTSLFLSDREDVPLVVATGPLTSEPLAEALALLTGTGSLSFYDALAPIVSYDSLDHDIVFPADRYGEPSLGEGEEAGGDYLNAPMTRDEYQSFYEALIKADLVNPRNFEDRKYFEGCLPVEVMAKRGFRTLTFGPMKPVGLINPRTGEQPYAVVQLRRENQTGSSWNMVGFQTRMTKSSQDKVLRLIPGLNNAEFLRYGAIHRNSYLEAPKVLDEYQRLINKPKVFIAGQLSGVEGYVESAAHGLIAGENAARTLKGLPLLIPPRQTAIGSLLFHLRPDPVRKLFSPSNVNFGLFPALPKDVRKKDSSRYRLNQARAALQSFIKEQDYAFVL